MPYLPNDFHVFPHPSQATSDGVLAIGGDLNPHRLELAYSYGIFPWYSAEDPMVWWSPDPRLVLYPEKLHIQKSMRSYFNQSKFQVTYNAHFKEVISQCAQTKRTGQEGGTWIHAEMIDAYEVLHQRGTAHSVEVWSNDKLVGGLYGISLGKVFFGESMFAHVANASKFGFISLVQKLQEQQYLLIDCQQETPHLKSLGAELISNKAFGEVLSENRKFILMNNHSQSK